MTLKCISLWQPWASAVALGLKQNETRAYPTRHRGALGICATLKRTRGLHAEWDKLCSSHSELHEAFNRADYFSWDSLPFGKLVCIVDVLECRPTESVSAISSLERDLGDYSRNRHFWILGNVRRLAEPLPVSAKQGFFFINVREQKLKFT